MAEEKKKSKTQIIAFTILLIIAAGNYMRLPHEGIRTVDFVQILVIGMLGGMLLLRSLQKT